MIAHSSRFSSKNIVCLTFGRFTSWILLHSSRSCKGLPLCFVFEIFEHYSSLLICLLLLFLHLCYSSMDWILVNVDCSFSSFIFASFDSFSSTQQGTQRWCGWVGPWFFGSWCYFSFANLYKNRKRWTHLYLLIK